MKTYIYNENLELIETLNYSVQDFSKNPLKYPLWKDSYYYSEKEYSDKNLIKIENGAIVEKTLVELKLENPSLLEDGEYISLNQIIKVEKPSEFRIWNKITNAWDIGDELIAHHINDLTNELSSIRDSKLEVGTLFEGDKLIKGRTQDVSDAIAQVMLKQLGGEIKWFFSNNITEEDITLDRMMAISTAIGGFRTYQFGREKEVFHHITQILTNEEAENFNPSLYW